MNKREYKKLQAEYGVKANNAKNWFEGNGFAFHVNPSKQAAYCKMNEYLWF